MTSRSAHHRGKDGRKVALAGVALGMMALALALGFVFIQLPSGSRFWAAVQNSGHCLAFAVFAFAAFAILNAIGSGWSRSRTWMVAGALFLLGLSIELGQAATGRGASSYDVFMNALGIAAGVSLYGCLAALRLDGKTSGSGERRGRRIRAAGLGATAVLLSALCVRLPIYLLVAELFSPALPVLVDFGRFGADRNIVTYNARVRIVEEGAGDGDERLAIDFLPGGDSTVGFLDVGTDWSGYRFLLFDVRNAKADAFELTLRLDLIQYDGSRRKRLYQRVPIGAGDSTVRVDIARLLDRYNQALAGGSEYRPWVKSVYLFVSDSDRPRSVLVDDLVLE